MNPSGLLDGDTIRRLLTEVADELASGPQRTLIIVGGSLLACHGLRDATHDVDSIRALDHEVRDAVQHVAQRHRLTDKWLNDSARAFTPATLDTADCEVLLDTPSLLVLGAALHDVFLMKLARADPADLADMRAIWPHIRNRFPTAAAITAAFYAAYPLEDRDPYLDAFIVDELARAGHQLPLT